MKVDKKRSTDTSNHKRFPDGFRVLQGKQEYISYPDHASIRIWNTGEGLNPDDHWHSATEIILPLEGEAFIPCPKEPIASPTDRC